MKRPNERLACVSFCLAVTTVLLAARIASATSRPKIRILTTVFPLLEFAREVAGDRGDVRMLLPPGSDVHTWQPRISDIEKLTSADMFIYIGPALEPWAQDITFFDDVLFSACFDHSKHVFLPFLKIGIRIGR